MIELIFKDPNCKKIGVRLSGGPDSAIVYFAVCNFYKNDNSVKIFPYTMSSPLRPHAITRAKKIIDFVTSTTGKSPEMHYHLHHLEHNSNNDNDTNLYEYTNGQELLEKNLIKDQLIDIRYTGLSMNCPIHSLEKYMNSLPPIRAMKYIDVLDTRARDRDNIFEKRVSYLKFSDSHSYYSFLPLVNSDKREVKILYDYYNLTSTLYPMTWSCESDQQAATSDPKHCGACYFCLEREFAFGRL